MLKCVDQKAKTWAHVVCVNWNPDVYFTDHTKSAIGGQLNQQRFEINCDYCRIGAGKGACI
jgi:hypothetical protein